MTRIDSASSLRLLGVRHLLLLGVLLGAMLFHVWQKVEMAAVERHIGAAAARVRELERARGQLLAGIAAGKDRGTIERLARQIGMVYPAPADVAANAWRGPEID